MKVLSIDVGLRNLSFACISRENDSYCISLWENHDLLSEPIQKCQFLTKKQKACGLACRYSCNETYSCKKHIQGGNFKEIKKKLIDSYTLQQISLIVMNKIKEFVSENTLVFENLDLILIEKQPKINVKMTMVSHLIFGKLTELLQVEKTKIRFVSAGKKAWLFKTEDTMISGTMKGPKGYNNRKNNAIEYVTKFLQSGKIQDSKKWLDFLESNSKRSDLCDSSSYCIAELMNVKK
jgi:hypothetical protein